MTYRRQARAWRPFSCLLTRGETHDATQTNQVGPGAGGVCAARGAGGRPSERGDPLEPDCDGHAGCGPRPGRRGAPGPAREQGGRAGGRVRPAPDTPSDPRHRPSLLGTPFAPTASKDAAAATAAYRMLTSVISTVPAAIPFPHPATLLPHGATEY